MKQRITKNTKIQKIVFDMDYNGKQYKDITLEYNFPLTIEEIHYEDNDSWNMVDIDDNLTIDFQIFGDDEEKGCKSELSIDGCVMELVDDCYEHTDEWIYGCFSNLRLYTEKGVKEVKLKEQIKPDETLVYFYELCAQHFSDFYPAKYVDVNFPYIDEKLTDDESFVGIIVPETFGMKCSWIDDKKYFVDYKTATFRDDFGEESPNTECAFIYKLK